MRFLSPGTEVWRDPETRMRPDCATPRVRPLVYPELCNDRKKNRCVARNLAGQGWNAQQNVRDRHVYAGIVVIGRRRTRRYGWLDGIARLMPSAGQFRKLWSAGPKREAERDRDELGRPPAAALGARYQTLGVGRRVEHRMVPRFDEEGEAFTEIHAEPAIDPELPQIVAVQGA